MTLSAAVAAVPLLLIVWAALLAGFVGLLTYRAQLSRYESEQLYLSETEITQEQEVRQSNTVRRIRKVEPYVGIFGGASALVTAGIVFIWVADAWKSLH